MTRGLATPVASTFPGTVRSPSSATRSGKRRRGRSRRHACRCYRRSRLWRALDARCVFPSAHKTWRGRLSPRHHLSVSRSPLSTSWWGSAAGWCMPIATKAMAARCMRHRRSGAKPGGSAVAGQPRIRLAQGIGPAARASQSARWRPTCSVSPGATRAAIGEAVHAAIKCGATGHIHVTLG